MNKKFILLNENIVGSSDFDTMVENLQGRSMAADIQGVGASVEHYKKALNDAVREGYEEIVFIPVNMSEKSEKFVELRDVVKEFTESKAVSVEIDKSYTTDLVLEDLIWESITSRTTDKNSLPELGADIEKLSHVIIDSKLKNIDRMSREEKIVARRVIHSTADYSFANTLQFSANAVAKGIEALKNKKPIICDVNMLKTAMTKVESEIYCLIADPEVIELAKKEKCTRATAAMITLKDKLDGAVVVVGNAPTAIWQLLKMDVKPAVVVGLPVGFVGARESKLELINSKHEYIANTSPKGGSPAAAAALNALALLARE